MKETVKRLLSKKDRTVPILSFPATSLLGVSVRETVTSAEAQARAVLAVYRRGNMGAAVMPMDLSVEAECFGAPIEMYEEDIPTVKAPILQDIAQAEALQVPGTDSGRVGVFAEGVRLLKEELKDTPVFCGAIGPFSLAGRLFDMTDLMTECYDSPESVALLLEKATDFIISYIRALKSAGADGVILAEPAAGLLSPMMCEEFSNPYVKRIFECVGDENFVFCYHNCGGSVLACAEGIADIGADIYHFGNAVPLEKLLDKMPQHSLIMGNIDPLLFKNGEEGDVRKALDALFATCGQHPRFMISSGCDIPAAASWDRLDEYFAHVNTLYGL